MGNNDRYFWGSGARFSKIPKTFRARKAIRETPTCLLCKAGLFTCFIGNKNLKNFAKFRAPRRLRCEDTKRIMSPEKSRDFRETGPRGTAEKFLGSREPEKENVSGNKWFY